MKKFGLQYDCGRFAVFGPEGGPYQRLEFESLEKASNATEAIREAIPDYQKPVTTDGMGPEEILDEE